MRSNNLAYDMNVEAEHQRHDEDDDPDMPELIGRCDSDSDESDDEDDDDDDDDEEDEDESSITQEEVEKAQQEEDDYQDLPDLVPRYDDDSDDDDSDDEDLTINHTEGATDETPSDKTRKLTQKSAPNRLLNLKKIKKVIDSNLTVCPICETNGRELCDGDSIGLQMEVSVCCTSCARVEMSFKQKIYWLKKQQKNMPS